MTALLRFAALSFSGYAEAGAPGLFAALSDLDRQRDLYAHRAQSAADQIGQLLVPHPALSKADRALALRVRRALHQRQTNAPITELAQLAEPIRADLAWQLHDLAAAAQMIESIERLLEQAVSAEETRLLALPWELLNGTSTGRHALRATDVYADIVARLAKGEPWTGKRMRKRSEYLWKMLRRATTRATPRGWYAHVASVSIADDGGWTVRNRLSIHDTAAVEVVENMFDSASGEHYSVTPLAWRDEEHIHVWTVQDDRPAHLPHPLLVQVRVRRTPALDAVWAGRMSDVPASFLEHLAGLGVLRLCARPQAVRLPWRPIERVEVREVADDSFVDVYRRPKAALSTASAEQLADLIGQAMRVMALTDMDSELPRPALPPSLTAEPRPVLDIAADCMNQELEYGAHAPHRHDWPVCRDPASRYGRFLRWMERQFPGQESVDIDTATLDAFDAPEPAVDWPIDFLLRPGTRQTVLHDLAPAGLLDARFAPALSALDGEPEAVSAYREYLRELSEQAGVPFVELVIPPSSALAANAVRRPCYTTMWTGDPDNSAYFPEGGPSEFIPLAEITLRQADGQIVAEARGRRIWPISHSVRVPQAPWDVLRALLLRAGPQADRRQWRPLQYSLTAWPDRTFVPRITVGSGLVVTPAQWRVHQRDLPDPNATTLQRVTALNRLRQRMRMPRWVMVATDPHDEPVTVDLESVRTIFPDHVETLLFTELLPHPDHLPVSTPDGDGHLAELLLRLPLHHTAHRPPALAGNTATQR